MDYSKLDQFEDIGKSLIDGMIFCGCKINFQDNEISKSGFILEIIDGRELLEYMTMNKGKICG